MRFFDMLNTQHLILGVFFGLIAALFVYIGFGASYYSTGKEEGGGESEKAFEHKEGFRSKSRPLPTVVLFLFIGFAVWLVCYVIFRGLKGGPL
jgi:ABC-type antimicrobial peptide transport system permease subunit